MRPAGSRCRFPAVVVVVLAAVAGVYLAVAGPTISSSTALAVEPPFVLSVSVDRSLSTVDDPITITMDGRLGRSVVGTKLVVRVKGPATLAQVGQADPELVEIHKYVKVLGEVPAPATTTTTDPDAEIVTTTTTTSTTTTTGPAVSSSAADLEAGVVQAEVVLEPGMPAEAGAYLLVVEVKSGQDVWASGQVWMGKAAPQEVPFDIAIVWPVALGIHRNADGVFYDQVLEKAVASGSGDLRGLSSLPARFADWDFTLAIEPVLLTQLRDMADGYTRLDMSGNEASIPKDAADALNAAAALQGLESLAGGGSTDIAVGPYSGADLSVLAAEGWRDGFEQVQMGKQELQQTLSLAAPLIGACSPGLGFTTDSIAYYADASIDHVVVGSELMGLLTEQVEDGTVAVRARDAENDRVTLVFADSLLGAALDTVATSGDAGVFCATLAAQLVVTPRDAVVVAPRTEFGLPSVSTLEILGEALEQAGWVDTVTLSQLLRSHSPGTRPILLQTAAGNTRGYIEESLLEELRTTHAVVGDLASIADPTRTSVETARRLMFIAQSRWWSRAGTSPREASMGLQYSLRARELAAGELGKIRLAGVESSTIMGRTGTVGIQIQNDADYPLTVDLSLKGTGVTLPEGEDMEVEAAPGRTVVQVKVEGTSGPHRLAAQLVAGSRILDQTDRSLRFVTITTVLPALIVGGLAIIVGLYFVVRRLLRRFRRAPAVS